MGTIAVTVQNIAYHLLISYEHRSKAQIPQKELKKIVRYILENRSDILAAWFDYFSE